jgi:hypothetical protein
LEDFSVIADASKGNEDKNGRKCFPSLQILGRDRNIIDGEYFPSLRYSRRWKYSGWGALPITSATSIPKNCSADGEHFPLPLPMGTGLYQ